MKISDDQSSNYSNEEREMHVRYSVYFRRAIACCDSDPNEARRLVREAEAHASPAVADHLILCARVWMEHLREKDQALRCLYLNECLLEPYDTRGMLLLTEAYINVVEDMESVSRCFKKLSAAPNCDGERVAEFLSRYGRSVALLTG